MVLEYYRTMLFHKSPEDYGVLCVVKVLHAFQYIAIEGAPMIRCRCTTDEQYKIIL